MTTGGGVVSTSSDGLTTGRTRLPGLSRHDAAYRAPSCITTQRDSGASSAYDLTMHLNPPRLDASSDRIPFDNRIDQPAPSSWSP